MRIDGSGGPIHIVTLCTGNAARSVMAGVMLVQLAEHEGVEVVVTTAGTHAVEGQPMSGRTRSAIESIGQLDTSGIVRHRSHQLSVADCRAADVIVAMEADHVRYVRRNHAEAAVKTATIRRLVGDLDAEGEPLVRLLETLGLEEVDLELDVDVIDPAGGEQPEYDACAAELWALCQSFVMLLG